MSRKIAIALLGAALLALPGCESEERVPEKEGPRKVSVGVGRPRDAGDDVLANLRDKLEDDPGNLSRRFDYACELEREGLLEGASQNYAIVAQELPRHRYTRPWLSFGRVELALHRDVSAKRAFEEVLATGASDALAYVENEDYRAAALLLRGILVSRGELETLVALRQRYLLELGGSESDWPAGRR